MKWVLIYWISINGQINPALEKFDSEYDCLKIAAEIQDYRPKCVFSGTEATMTIHELK